MFRPTDSLVTDAFFPIDHPQNSELLTW